MRSFIIKSGVFALLIMMGISVVPRQSLGVVFEVGIKRAHLLVFPIFFLLLYYIFSGLEHLVYIPIFDPQAYLLFQP